MCAMEAPLQMLEACSCSLFLLLTGFCPPHMNSSLSVPLICAYKRL